MNLESWLFLPNLAGRALRALLPVFASVIAMPVVAATYQVTVNTDNGAFMTGQGGGVSGDLRYCIVQANANPGSLINMEGRNVLLNAPLPPITASVFIQASNNSSVSGQGQHRLFFIDAPGATVTFQNFKLRDALARGGAGSTGNGGGGMGAGPGAFVNAGTLALNNITVQNTVAQGGAGGAHQGQGLPGGGGGLGGNGGYTFGGGGGFLATGGNGESPTSPHARAGGGGGGFLGNGGNSNYTTGGGGGGITAASGATAGSGGGAGAAVLSNGNDGGAYGGGGGAGGGPSESGAGVGGRGGKFGGGGGGSQRFGSMGGAGGDFGGGGAGALLLPTGGFGARGGAGGYGGGGGGGGLGGGAAGFGGGAGGRTLSGSTETRAGNGGSAYGGVIFVRGSNGAKLQINNTELPGGTLVAGAGGPETPGITDMRAGFAGTTAGTSVYLEGSSPDLEVTADWFDFTISGSIATNAGIGLQKYGPMSVTLTAINSHFGTTANAGVLKVAGAGTLGSTTGSLNTYGTGTVDLNGSNQSVGVIRGSSGGTITNDAPGTLSTLTVGNGNENGGFGGVLRDGAGRIALRKIGSGWQDLRYANAYSGPTEVFGGELYLYTDSNSGPLIPSTSSLTVSTGSVVIRGPNYNALGSGSITLGPGGMLDAQSSAHTLGPLFMQGGLLTGSNPDPTFGNFVLGDNVVVTGGTQSALTAPVVQLKGTRTFDVADGAAANDLLITSALANHGSTVGSLVKTGAGTLTLTGSSTYTGGTTVNGGTLQLSGGGPGGAIGTIVGTLTANAGTVINSTVINAIGYLPGSKINTLVLNDGAVLNAQAAGDHGWGVAYTLHNGSVLSTNGGVSSATAASKVAYGGELPNRSTLRATGTAASEVCGRLDLRSTLGQTMADITVDAGATLNVSAAVTNSDAAVDLRKRGAGLMRLSGGNTYTGNTVIEAGTLALAHANAITAGQIVFTGGSLRLDPGAADVSSRIQAPTSTANKLQIDVTTGSASIGNPLGGVAALRKLGAATLTLTTTHSYSGGTEVAEGTLVVAASGRLANGPVTISSGATLDLRAFGTAGYAFPAGTVVTNNGTILGYWYVAGGTPKLSVQQPVGTSLAVGATVTFDAVAIGSSTSRTFALANAGPGQAQVLGITIVGADAGRFALDVSGIGSMILAGQYAFTVTVSPTVHGAISATLRVQSNDPVRPVIDVNLAASGIGTPVAALAADTLPFTAGTALVWGRNGQGQTTVPTGLTALRSLATGRWHTLALGNGGSVSAWGYNGDGQVSVPAQLTAIALAAGGYHSLALRDDGTVVGFGLNTAGQAAINPAFAPYTAIAAGELHSLALTRNGRVVAAGSDAEGQASVPPDLGSVIAIAAGVSHSLALKGDGSVVAWGRNVEGQRSVPAAAAGVQAIAAGGAHSVALLADGSVLAWGSNAEGQCTVPAGLGDVVAVAAGEAHTVALKRDGTIVGWGRNGDGQSASIAGVPGAAALASSWNHNAMVAAHRAGFARQPLGVASPAKIFTIGNTGSAPLAITSVTLAGPHPGDFAIETTGMQNPVALAGQTSFKIRFTPTRTGARVATVRLATNDPARPLIEANLDGLGVVSALALSGNGETVASGSTTPDAGNNTDFGTGPVGSTVQRSFVIANGGTGDLVLPANAIAITGGAAGDFAASGITLPATIAPGGSLPFTIGFTAPTVGLRSATVSIASNDGEHNPYSFAVAGTGVNDAPVIAPISNLSIDENTTAAVAVEVSDSETRPSSLSLTVSANNATLMPPGALVLEGSGGTRSLQLRPAANASGTATITLTVDDGAGGNASTSFVLTVNPVNGMPSYVVGGNRTHPFGAPAAQSFADGALAIEDGDPEVAQALTFNLSNDRPALFAVPPAISAAGVLSYTLSGVAGTAVVTVTLSDDTTAGGPALTTAAQSFTITVQPQQFTVTASAGPGGALSCLSPVARGQATTCTAVPNSDRITAAISGCGGVATTARVNVYTTSAITADCTVSATFALPYCRLDINDDGQLDSATDAVLILRYLHGVRGNALVAGLPQPLAGSRNGAQAVEAFLAAQDFNVLGDAGAANALRDGLVIARYLRSPGVTAAAIVAGSGIDAAAAATVRDRVAGWCP